MLGGRLMEAQQGVPTLVQTHEALCAQQTDPRRYGYVPPGTLARRKGVGWVCAAQIITTGVHAFHAYPCGPCQHSPLSTHPRVPAEMATDRTASGRASLLGGISNIRARTALVPQQHVTTVSLGQGGDSTCHTSRPTRLLLLAPPPPCAPADADLKKLPRRRTDGAYVVDTNEHTIKLYATDGGVKYIKR